MSTFDLGAFSDAIADLAASAAPTLASLPRGHGFSASAFHWRDGLYVTAEEVLDDAEPVELTLPSGETVKADLVGRDPSTGVALLRTAGQGHAPVLAKAAAPRVGSVAIAAGQSWAEPLASFGSVGIVGPAWRSMRGGRIARRVNLAIAIGARFEGGPVLDAKGALLGMLLFGPRRRVLVMPHENIEQAVVTLETKGHVARGYLGAGLHPVREGGVRGAMVMSLDENGPAKAAGIQLGDIIRLWNGEPVAGPRELLHRLGPDSAGKSVMLGILRAGEARDIAVTVGEKPLG